MSLGLVCDLCDDTLLVDSDVRYVLDIRGYAAYDPLEITNADLEKDLKAEIDRLLSRMEGEDPRSLEEDVFKEFRLDLCPRCWKLYRKDPLAGFRERS